MGEHFLFLAPVVALQLQMNIFTYVPLITLVTTAFRGSIGFISNLILLSSTRPYLPRAEFLVFIISQQCITLHLMSGQSSSKDMQLDVVHFESNEVIPEKRHYFALISFKIWYRFSCLLWQISEYCHARCRDDEP